jgi:hypothetical protein
VYELAGLAPNVIDSGFIKAVKEKATAMGDPKVLPLLIQFSDKDGREDIPGYPQKGQALQSLLIKEGYKCDRFKLGHNPKSGNRVSLYHWWVHKGTGGVSKVREYEYNKKEQTVVESGARVSGAAKARGTGFSSGGRLRSYSRTAS